jgi:hypothetical protein
LTLTGMPAHSMDSFCAFGLCQIESRSDFGMPVPLLYPVFPVRFSISNR